ncbi:MAG: hypothetical protein NT085_05530 [candidate division SR1 bacterium]|nr:hypothetical protein [candidate division SR1 bacterium]
MEKACLTVLESDGIVAKMEALGSCTGGIPSRLCFTLIELEPDHCPFIKEITEIKKEIEGREMVHELMFGLLQSRLNVQKLGLEDIMLCSDFQVTTSTEIDTLEIFELFPGAEEMSLEEMLQVSLKGTFLEPVIAIMESKQFIDEDAELKDGEVFIREMTDFEKALWTVYSTLFEEQKSKKKEKDTLEGGDAFFTSGIVLSIGPRSLGANRLCVPIDENHPDVLTVKNLSEEIDVLEFQIDLLNKFFWTLIKGNIPQEQMADFSTIGVRQGFKIVTFNKE